MFIILAVLSAFFGEVFSFGVALASPLLTPRLKVGTKNAQTVVLRIRLGSARIGSSTALIVERRLESGSEFRVLATLKRPPSSFSLVDFPRQGGPISYRARLKNSKAYSAWSPIQTVELKGGIDDFPTPDPTAVSVEIPVETPLPSPIQTNTPTVIPVLTSPEPTLAPGLSECPDGYEEGVLDLVNDMRLEDSLLLFSSQAQLKWAARSHAIHMAANNLLSHDGWLNYVQTSGFQPLDLAENIAVGFASPESVVNAWMASPGHRGNILSDKFQFLAVACIADKNGGLWWVQIFGALQCNAM